MHKHEISTTNYVQLIHNSSRKRERGVIGGGGGLVEEKNLLSSDVDPILQ